MSLLRQNKDTLMGVLEPFIRDPTVSWGRAGRAQRTESVTKGPIGAIQDNDNTDAKEALLKIMERLNGVYNLCHPSGEDVILPLPFYLHSFNPFFLLFSFLSFLSSFIPICLYFFLHSFLPAFFSFLHSSIPLFCSPSPSLLALSSCPIFITVLVLDLIH